MDSRSRFRNVLLLVMTATALITFALEPRSSRADIDAWPLLELDEDSITIAYPLFVKEGDFMMAFPFYYRTNQGRDHHVLWPLLKVSEGKLDRLAPVFFRAHDDTFTLFPLIHQSDQSTWLMIPPVYLSRSSDFHAVFPLYAHDEQTTWAFPNLRIDHAEDGRLERLRSFGLFDYSADLSGHGGELDMAFISSFAWGGEKTHARVLPLFSQSNSPTGQSTWVGPVHYAVKDGLTSHCVLPLYCEIKKTNLHSRLIGPWYASQNPSRSTTGVLGLYGIRDEVLPSGHRIEKLSLLAWMYSREVQRDAAGSVLSRSRRFAIFTDKRDGDRRSFGLLGFPLWERSAS